MNKLLKQLKSLKRSTAVSAMDGHAVARSWEQIAEAIGANDSVVEQMPAVSEMYLEYLRWNLSKYISRPVVAGAFSVAIVAGGWITSVSAADSLPGDRLYSVKMITERAQLKLASLDKKAVLHTEFAGRRLQEAADLQESAAGQPNKDALVRGAIEAYKQEVASAGNSLRQLRNEGDQSTLTTATSVQQSLQEIDTTIDEVVAESDTPEATQEALAAKEVTKEVNGVATTVAVEVHEEQQSELSEHEVKEMFKRELGQIETRQRFDLERIEVIRNALADESVSYEGLEIPEEDTLLSYEYTIEGVDDQLSEAMNNFAAGGYRSAFETLQEIDGSLLDIEAELAHVEIVIMQAHQQPAETVEDIEAEKDEVPLNGEGDLITPAQTETDTEVDTAL